MYHHISKHLWVPDSAAKSCFYCNGAFNTFRRKHHCRVCGAVFCAKCCPKQKFIEQHASVEQRPHGQQIFRVCISCSKLTFVNEASIGRPKCPKVPSSLKLTDCQRRARTASLYQSPIEPQLVPDAASDQLHVVLSYDLAFQNFTSQVNNYLKSPTYNDPDRTKPSMLRRNEFSNKIRELLSEKLPRNLVSEFLTAAQQVSLEDFHIKTIACKEHVSLEHDGLFSPTPSNDENNNPDDGFQVSCNVLDNCVIGSQASLTSTTGNGGGRVLFVESSIQPDPGVATNIQQIHQENYRLKQCADRVVLEGVRSIVVLGSCCWAFREALESHKIIVIACTKRRQFQRLMRALGCQMPLVSITDLLMEPAPPKIADTDEHSVLPSPDTVYQHAFGEFEAFEYLHVGEKQLFSYKTTRNFKSIVLVGQNEYWLAWVKLILNDAIKCFINFNLISELPWIGSNFTPFKYFEYQNSMPHSQYFKITLTEFFTNNFQIKSPMDQPLAVVSVNQRVLDWSDFAVNISDNVAETHDQCRQLKGRFDGKMRTLGDIRINGIYEDHLEKKWSWKSAEDMKARRASTVLNLPKSLVYGLGKTINHRSFHEGKLCELNSTRFQAYTLDSDGNRYYRLYDFLHEKAELGIFKGCKECKQKIQLHTDVYDCGLYRVTVKMEPQLENATTAVPKIDSRMDRWWFAFQSRRDNTLLECTTIPVAVLDLPFPVFLETLTLNETLHVFTPNHILYLEKVPTNAKPIVRYTKTDNFANRQTPPKRKSSISSKSNPDGTLSIGQLLARALRHGSSNFSSNTETQRAVVKSFLVDNFKEVRQSLLLTSDYTEANFIQSVASLEGWDAVGGKKCKSFSRSSDSRLILKKLENPEAKFFETNGSYITDYFCTNPDTLLARLYGVFQIKMYDNDTKLESGCYALMENLFYGIEEAETTRLFDLKGSRRNRFSQSPEKIIWDSDYLSREEMVNPLESYDFYAEKLAKQLECDSRFLSRHDVMDYSLVVAETVSELRVGIVDYLRSYTWDKALETIVKTYMPESTTDHSLEPVMQDPIVQRPTILPASEYRTRFLAAIANYIHVVPFDWILPAS